MKVVFLTSGLSVSEPLGIMCLSASLKKAGHQTELVCFKSKNFFQKLEAAKPEVVAYSITTGMHREAILINREIKKRFQVLSVFGGPHPTFFPELIQEDGIDAICRGEGEEAFVEYVDRLSAGKSVDRVRNFWVKRGRLITRNLPRRLNENLDRLPFADRDIIYDIDRRFRRLKIKKFMARRGCPFKCTYCFNRNYNLLYKEKGRIVRQRSVENVIDEVLEVKRTYSLGTAKFVDDTFNIDPVWLKEFCGTYKRRVGLPFICNLRADLVTADTARQLADAGCVLICMGIETGDEGVRRRLLERNMSNGQIVNACRWLKGVGIKIFSTNILGLPGETLDQTFESILFNAKCKINFPEFSLFQPYPNTVITDYAIKNGYFDGNYDHVKRDYLHESPLKLGKKEKKRLENLQELGILLVKFPFLAPLVRFLINLPENSLYKLAYTLSYGAYLWLAFSDSFGSDINIVESIKRLLDYTL